MDIDKLLIKCGDFGRYQFIILAIFGVVNIICSMHLFTQTIISFVPDHWCYHEKLVNRSFAEIEEIYKRFPRPSCTRLDDINSTHLVVSKQKCDRWFYNYDFNYKSMNTELNWVCEDAYKARVGQSFFFVGSVLGSMFYGVLSDKYGRLPALVLAHMSAFIGDFATIFARDVYLFSICRLISGLALDSNFVLMYIIVLEYLRPSMRTLCLNMIVGLFYCLGLMAIPWVAVGVENYQYYLITTSVPVLCMLVFYYVIQESAQWLVTRRDIDGAILRLRRVAKMNGRMVPDSDFEEFRKTCEKQFERQNSQSEKEPTLLDMFRTPRLRKTTLILFFKSMVITLCYDAVSRNVEGMGISPFVMFSLSALSVFPASLCLVLLQDKIGRKGMASGALLLAGIFTAGSGTIIAYERHSASPLLLAGLTIAGRFGVAIAFESGSQYATELIPTCVRGQGVAAVHVAGFGATFFSPYILLLGSYVKEAPPIILGVLFFAGAYVCLLLPETLNKTLPKTLQEAEVFGKGESMFDFACLSKRKRRRSSESLEANQTTETYRPAVIETLDMNGIQKTHL